jgi:hypothetical protein
MAIRRLLGIKEDPEAGGSEYDDLTAGAIDNADVFWPVTGGTFDRNVERYDRNDEVRGRRAGTAPLAFRARPVLTVPIAAYASILGTALKKTLGGTDVVTGSVAPYTHTFGILGFGATALPCVFAQIVRDDLNYKMSGGAFNRLSLSFPLDSEGTMEFEIWGLYHDSFDPTGAPSASYSGISDDVMMLRDATCYIDGSMTAIPDLEGFDLTFVNNLNPKFYAGRNVVTKSLGTPTQTKRLWFPTENKVGASQDVTFGLQFGNANATQEIAHDYAQIQKFVFEVEGATLGSGGRELLRITIYNGAWTGGGTEALTARDDITARFDGIAGYSTADSADIKVELVNDQDTAYA